LKIYPLQTFQKEENSPAFHTWKLPIHRFIDLGDSIRFLRGDFNAEMEGRSAGFQPARDGRALIFYGGQDA